MIPLTAAEAGAALGRPPLDGAVPGVSIDTRTLCPGDLFVALKGEVHDGHDFVQAALAAGASGAVVDRAVGVLPGDAERTYRVPDTLAALSALAGTVRAKSSAHVLGVTGSVGKTSTKDILRTVTSLAGSVVATHGNQNNEVGVPLTLLRLQPSTSVAVVEMGMRGRGQIAALAAVARPDVGLITKVAPVHLEMLGTLEEIAAAKAELLLNLRPGGVGVLPLAAPHLPDDVFNPTTRILRFGFGPGEEAAEVWGSVRLGDRGGRFLEMRWDGNKAEVELEWTSRHRYENAVGAVAAAYALGLAPERCLAVLHETVFTPLRGDEFLRAGILVLDDSYNANPAAMRSALDTLRDRAGGAGGRAVAVLGDMLELGPEAEGFHREVGLYAAESGVDILWAVGRYSTAMIDSFCSEAQAGHEGRYLGDAHASDAGCRRLGVELALSLKPRDVVLVKASRGLRLERVVEGLREGLAERDRPAGRSAG